MKIKFSKELPKKEGIYLLKADKKSKEAELVYISKELFVFDYPYMKDSYSIGVLKDGCEWSKRLKF